MSKTSNGFAGVLIALILAGSAGAAFAQQGGQGSGGGGGGGGGGEVSGSSGGGATSMPASFVAVVPNNTNRRPRGDGQQPQGGHGSGCTTPTEGIRGPRLIGPCGPY